MTATDLRVDVPTAEPRSWGTPIHRSHVSLSDHRRGADHEQRKGEIDAEQLRTLHVTSGADISRNPSPRAAELWLTV